MAGEAVIVMTWGLLEDGGCHLHVAVLVGIAMHANMRCIPEIGQIKPFLESQIIKLASSRNSAQYAHMHALIHLEFES